VGDTTDTTCRIWIRADDPGDEGARLSATRRTIGVVGFVEPGDEIGEAWYFRLPREFDRTGMFTIGKDVDIGSYRTDVEREKRLTGLPRARRAAAPTKLKPDTEYRVRAATLTLDDPWLDAQDVPDWKLRERLPDIDSIKNDMLAFDAHECEAVFRTFPPSKRIAPRLSFLLGSCRYPGLLWKIKEADRIFGPMQEHYAVGNQWGGPARFNLMVGDQIYADTLNRAVPLLKADSYEEFQERYISAFEGPNLRQLLRTSPTYMILDDHEIEDNWSQDQLGTPSGHRLFNVAVSAYMNYQWSHGPRTWGELLYYRFECGGYPFFVLDTRTQRFKDQELGKGLRDNHLLGWPNIDPAHPGQLKRLLDWLAEQQTEHGNIPKFIVSASVFAPNPINERLNPGASEPPVDAAVDLEAFVFETNRSRREASDSWPGYPNTRLAILAHIVEKKIQNVIFLSGDIHCSNIAEIAFTGTADAERLRAYCVTSSAFYWPFPFADGDPNGYVHDSRAKGQEDPFPIVGTPVVMHYRSYGYTQQDNFCRLDVDKAGHTLTVSVFNEHGEPARVAADRAAPSNVNTLDLAPWK